MDLVFLSGVGEENLVEAHRKCVLFVGVGGPTMSKVAYPFNLNVSSPFLSDWLFGSLHTTCVQGTRASESKKKLISNFLGRGKSKNF